MKIYKTIEGIVLEHNVDSFVCNQQDWDEYINRDYPACSAIKVTKK